MSNQKTQIDSHVTLAQNIKVWTSFDQEKLAVFARPNEILEQFKNTPVVWTDTVQSTINFADAKNCLVVNTADIVAISIQNIKPAKGAGGSYLILKLKNAMYDITVLFGPCSSLNAYKNKIGKMVDLEVSILEEYSDF